MTSFLPPLIAYGLIGAVVFSAGWWVNGNRWEARHNKAAAAWAQEQEAQADARLHVIAHYRKIEQDLRARIDAAQRNHADEIRVRDARIAALSRAADRLRDTAASRASGPASGDSIAACRADAAALRDVLGEIDAEAGRLAETAERHAGEVRLLLEAWPRL